MTEAEIVQELNKLGVAERLSIIEATVHAMREELPCTAPPAPKSKSQRQRELAVAAESLLPDYTAGGELTAFTALDGEDFHA